ncbi:nucleotide exchange factor GrpE [Buchnera aphidicola]|uniref:Protein GrpE n=1 Tax=Buchnera aphidicola (Macrosiphum gaurae) TaxID=2315801 RepID=A0A4D6Y8R9_9GAMM|nr:nucleotide exchange factor GrpE [Buchnera aphidicola]QCI22641.1 nucleotide exchange factor GrpE [Buchnera aphidicola (Macrosiphum gaurae)]
MKNQEKKIYEENIFKNNDTVKENKDNSIDVLKLQSKKIEDLKLEIIQNQKKISDIELRKLANIENIKKNTEEKIKTIKKTETERFLKEIIPIIDCLEEILILSDKLNTKDEPLIKGIELTLQSLLNILHKLGVKIEGKKNELFNPDIHISISEELSENTLPNHIISTNKKGFTFNKVLLRKAIVKVAKN